MKKKICILLLSVFIFSAAAQCQISNKLTNEQKTWLSKGNRHEKNGWIYLHIEGSSEERGFQYGYLMVNEINGSMTADGGIVLGHNTMSSYISPFCNIILDILPEKGHRILMQAYPGFIHSCTDFFITDAGLVGSETTIGGFFPFDDKGIPEFDRMRRATQDASSIDEWCDIMKKGKTNVLFSKMGKRLRYFVRCKRIPYKTSPV